MREKLMPVIRALMDAYGIINQKDTTMITALINLNSTHKKLTAMRDYHIPNEL